MIQKINDLTPYYKVDRYVIPNTDDAYRIGTNGVVESRWDHIADGQPWRWEIGSEGCWRPLTPYIDTNGYPRVQLKIGGKRQRKKISRLVCEAVYGPCPPGMEACHVYDPNKLNNWSWNLKWDTHQNNNLMKRDHGTQYSGETHPSAKLTWAIVGQLRADWVTNRYTYKQLGEKYGISLGHAFRIVTNESWSV